jgi:hypothetical protein
VRMLHRLTMDSTARLTVRLVYRGGFLSVAWKPIPVEGEGFVNRPLM